MPKLWTRPSPELATRIDRIWSWVGESELPVLLPGTGNEALFNLGDPLEIVCGSETRKLPESFIMSMRTARFAIRPTGTANFVCVRFKSGRLGSFCRESMRELSDRFVPCADIWGRPAEELRDRMLDETDFAARSGLANDFFRRTLSPATRISDAPAWVNRSIDRLYYGFSSTTVDAVADAAGVSRRQLERRFAEATGTNPKAFQRTARFQTVLKNLLLARSSDYLDAALAAGYYDQAHFIHEFREYVGETPGEFLRAKNFTSHFYNYRIAN